MPRFEFAISQIDSSRYRYNQAATEPSRNSSKIQSSSAFLRCVRPHRCGVESDDLPATASSTAKTHASLKVLQVFCAGARVFVDADRLAIFTAESRGGGSNTL